MCAVCKGGGGGVCYGRSISAQASFTRGSELPLSKWRQRAHKDNRTLVSSRKPVFCLLQTCSCAPRARCSEALKKKGPYHRGLKKNKESPPAECSNCVVFCSFCRVLASLAHLSVIWLCSVMFSTHRELSKQEAMMDCLWQKGLVRTSSSDSLAALQWCDTDHFQNQKYNCGVEVLLI